MKYLLCRTIEDPCQRDKPLAIANFTGVVYSSRIDNRHTSCWYRLTVILRDRTGYRANSMGSYGTLLIPWHPPGLPMGTHVGFTASHGDVPWERMRTDGIPLAPGDPPVIPAGVPFMRLVMGYCGIPVGLLTQSLTAIHGASHMSFHANPW